MARLRIVVFPERELLLQESFQPFPLLLQKFLPFLYGKHGYGF